MTSHHDSQESRIAFIGLGKVGTAMAVLLRKAGYRLAALYDVSPEARERAASATGAPIAGGAAEAASRSDMVFLTTGDDQILAVCREIAEGGGFHPGQTAVHMSGAGGLDLLEPAREAGACRASIHPMQAFADSAMALENLPGSVFGVTADEPAREWAVRIVGDLGGTPFFVAGENKALYHAAACMASNYLVTLIRQVEAVYESIGMDREDAVRAVWPLIGGTLRNIETMGTVRALTGPIVRGDAGTIEKHLAAFREKLPHLLETYRVLGKQTVKLAREKGTLSLEQAEQLNSILSGGTS
ncbi:MAG TPA: DUF2520 domain-containing protein [Syntrophales bacterium]|nr:DUF2520 domain-containing protein [Syntrophales bacterium]